MGPLEVSIFFIGSISYIAYCAVKEKKNSAECRQRFMKSEFADDLCAKNFKLQNGNQIVGNYKGFQMGIYYLEKNGISILPKKKKIELYASMDCLIPFMQERKGVKAMTDFQIRHSDKYMIDRRDGIACKIDEDTDLKTLLKIFDQMIDTAKKEEFLIKKV